MLFKQSLYQLYFRLVHNSCLDILHLVINDRPAEELTCREFAYQAVRSIKNFDVHVIACLSYLVFYQHIYFY